MELKRRHPALIILRALLDGHRIKYDNWTLVLNNDMLCLEYLKTTTGEKESSEIVYLPTDMPLSHFISWCKAIPDDILFGIVADITLTSIKRSGHESD